MCTHSKLTKQLLTKYVSILIPINQMCNYTGPHS